MGLGCSLVGVHAFAACYFEMHIEKKNDGALMYVEQVECVGTERD